MTLKKLRWKFLICPLVSLCSATFVANAQSTTDDVAARLKGKPLYLRGCWRDKDLKFNRDGVLIGQSKPVTITLCGFEFKSVKIKSDRLVIEGERVGLEFPDGNLKRVILKDDADTHIQIQSGIDHDYAKALNAVFVYGLEGMVPTLPSYWQEYGREHFLAAGSATLRTPRPGYVKTLGVELALLNQFIPRNQISMKPQRV